MLNQETIIKLAVQHGFKVGRDAGGEYVAPKYEDAVGSLVALVQAAYAMGQEAQQAVPIQAIHLGFDYLDNGQIVATYAVPVESHLAPKLYTEPPAMLIPDGYVPVPLSFLQGFQKLAHNYSLQAQAPDYYVGIERDAFSAAYARCGSELAQLRDKLVADLNKLRDMLHDEQKGGE